MRGEERQKLLKILGLLASQNDGERASAALRATEFLARHGLDWTDVVAAIPEEPEIVPTDPDLFILDDISKVRNDLAVSEAMRSHLESELELARARLDGSEESLFGRG